MSNFELNWVIEIEDAGKLLREFLREKRVSKTALTNIKFQGGRILVNRQEVTVRYTLERDDQVKIEFPIEEKSESMIGERIPLDIIFEDDTILIVNKPAGMNTIPSRKDPTGSLANAIVGHYQQIGLCSTVHVVTRLDRDTSGLVLIAKHRHTHHLLSEDQKNGLVNRYYEVFVHGRIEGFGSIEEPIGRNIDSIIEREVREDGQYAYTEYQTLSIFDEFSHMRIKLKTGRTHQIRVHMAHVGHPLLGDTLYGGSDELMARQALHCCWISLIHPVINEKMDFSSKLPDDMQKIVEDRVCN